MTHFYPIGTANTPWTTANKTQWFESQSIKRSYLKEVLEPINQLSDTYTVEQYGALPIDADRYPLMVLKSKNWIKDLPTILITGGVHGYETSGVQGALLFAKQTAQHYESLFNFVIVPCVSPWGYEVVNRWNPNAIDPNRSFYTDSPSEESAYLMDMVGTLSTDVYGHFDLHETTDSDETEFRPALAARDGKEYEAGMIPDGFYTVDNSEAPCDALQKAIIDSVREVTHIAPADHNNQIIGSDVVQEGVIRYPLKALSLCAGLSGARFCTTTEVYPDSPKVDANNCNLAQVSAIEGALKYLSKQM
jgi:hypothetical protein